MMAENIEAFRKGLIEQTKEGKLDWKPLSSLEKWDSIYDELNRNNVPVDYGVNSIRLSNSYYLNSGDGYVFLLELYHGDPHETSPEMDTLALVAKVNDFLPADNLTYFVEDEQEQLRALQMLIGSYYDEKYAYPDALYNFFSQVLGTE